MVGWRMGMKLQSTHGTLFGLFVHGLSAPHHQVGECEHFKAMGQIHPKQACFILCGSQCK